MKHYTAKELVEAGEQELDASCWRIVMAVLHFLGFLAVIDTLWHLACWIF